MIIFTGCGRSGTRFVARLMSMHDNFDIGHERMGKDGISSWDLAFPGRGRWSGLDLTDLQNEAPTIIHLVRHPLDSIGSFHTIAKASWVYICSKIPARMGMTLLTRSMRYWLYWNLRAERIARYRFQVETLRPNRDGGREYARLCGVCGIRPDSVLLAEALDKPHYLNSRAKRNSYRKVTIRDLLDENANLTWKIAELATRYGYKLEVGHE